MLDEKLSALIDDALDASEIDGCIDELLVNEQARQKWSRHHLVKAALKDQLADTASMNITDRVMAALDTPEETLSGARVIAFRKPVFKRPYQWASGLAVAASVAAVALFAPLGLNDSMDQDPVAATQAATADQSQVRKLAQVRRAQANEEAQRELQQYLLDHEALARGHGLNSQRRYMRMASPSTAYVAYSPE